MHGDAIFFLAGVVAPLALLIAMPRLWRQVLAGFVLFLYLLFAFAGLFPLLALLLVGLVAGLIARPRGRSFLLWWAYGTVLPVVAIPHALLLKRTIDPPSVRETYS